MGNAGLRRGLVIQVRLGWVMIAIIMFMLIYANLRISHAENRETVSPEELVKSLLAPLAESQIVYYELAASERGPDVASEAFLGARGKDASLRSVAGYSYTKKRSLTSLDVKLLWQRTLLDPATYGGKCRRTAGRVTCQSMSKCFDPGAALQFVKDNKVVTFVICLECQRIELIAEGIAVFVSLTRAGEKQICRAERRSGGQCD